jgi:4-aminobutyrate aminotransferase
LYNFPAVIAPRIRVRPPGPRARRIIALDERYLSPCVTRVYPLAIASGRGTTVTDVDGNVYLDFTSGVAVNALGHAHPDVVEAIRAQAGRFVHMAGTDFYYDVMAELAARLCRMAGGPPKRVFFGNSGTEAVEAALKLAIQHTGRHKIIGFVGGFHGRTMGSLSVTASKVVQRAGYPMGLPVIHVPYPNPYRPILRGELVKATINYIEEQVFRRLAAPSDVAALIVEPIQGEGGTVVAPRGFLRALRRLCTRHGILMVCDEIQSGMGRTGKLFAYMHEGIEPDVVCFAKAVAGGLPLGGILAPAKLHTWVSGAHANTFGGNPVACAAALVVLDHLGRGLMERARRMGAHLGSRLKTLVRRHARLGDARGVGLMQGVEVVADKRTRARAPELRGRLVLECFRRGLLLMGSGDSSIRFLPPLTVTREELDAGLKIFEDVVERFA